MIIFVSYTPSIPEQNYFDLINTDWIIEGLASQDKKMHHKLVKTSSGKCIRAECVVHRDATQVVLTYAEGGAWYPGVMTISWESQEDVLVKMPKSVMFVRESADEPDYPTFTVLY